MHWETKKKFIQLALLRYLLYCTGVEQNGSYLQDVPEYF